MHPNRQFLAHFVVHMPSCLHVLFHVAHPLHSNRGRGNRLLGYVPSRYPRVRGYRRAQAITMQVGGGATAQGFAMIPLPFQRGCTCCPMDATEKGTNAAGPLVHSLFPPPHTQTHCMPLNPIPYCTWRALQFNTAWLSWCRCDSGRRRLFGARPVSSAFVGATGLWFVTLG